MAWLWSSWEEYENYVVPVCVDKNRSLRPERFYSWFELEEKLRKAVDGITSKLEALAELGFDGNDNTLPQNDTSNLNKLRGIIIGLIYDGEELLLYHKRLAISNDSEEFLGSHDMFEHWEPYSTTGVIFNEIQKLVKGSQGLIDGYYKIIRDDDKFLLGDLELPKELDEDFILARNLFSVGFDEVGVLIAGRGLEGILRKIAKQRKIMVTIRNKPILASDVDTYDLIETMSRVKWKATGTPLVSKETKALLHYLRTIRNEGAHSGTKKRQANINPRGIASIVIEIANQLWKDTTKSRAKLEPTAIIKDW